MINKPRESVLPASATAMDESVEPIVCDLSAIPLKERARHIQLARTLVSGDERAIREIENGLAIDLPPERLVDVAKFVDNERRCCRHLTFALDVPAGGGNLTLRVTGPGAREEFLPLLQGRPVGMLRYLQRCPPRRGAAAALLALLACVLACIAPLVLAPFLVRSVRR